jgi:hypothetical protein
MSSGVSMDGLLSDDKPVDFLAKGFNPSVAYFGAFLNDFQQIARLREKWRRVVASLTNSWRLNNCFSEDGRGRGEQVGSKRRVHVAR